MNIKNTIAVLSIIVIFTFGRSWYDYALHHGVKEPVAARHYFTLEMVSWLIAALWFIKRQCKGVAAIFANWLVFLIIFNIRKDLVADPNVFDAFNWVVAAATLAFSIYEYIQFKKAR